MSTNGSSSIPNSLVFSGVNFVTGPTGSTGPTGATGISATGPRGPNGPALSRARIIGGSTLGLTFTNPDNTRSTFLLSVTGPSGSSTRITNVNFIVGETGGSESIGLFGGPDPTDLYKLYFKTIQVFGEATGGISGDAFYIASPSTTNGNVGSTGSLFYVNTGSVITPTNDTNTNYYRSVIVPNVSSDFGVTLDTFTFNIGQNLDLETADNTTVNINWFKVTNNSAIDSTLASNTIQSSSFWSGSYNRTDQGTYIVIQDKSNNLYPKVSFRTEGITLNSSGKQYDATQVDIVGKGITYGTETYKDRVLGSCCYCTSDDVTDATVNRNCIDYTTKTFCDSISGNFGFNTCNDRYLSNDCYSGGACCVNGVCVETSSDFCAKVYGKFYPNVRCNELEDGCPSGCAVDASCCIDGICYSLPSGDASEDLCRELKGNYSATTPCSERNCCVEGFLGACCLGPDDCRDDITPLECKNLGGVYQGPGTVCTSSDCCKDSTDQTLSFRVASYTNTNNEVVPTNIKIGDYFGGGIVAGFVGYPTPAGFEQDSYIAKGEVISEIENYTLNSVKRYIPVNGVYNSNLKCNCSNFSPSRYVDLSAISLTNGKAAFLDVKSLSGVNEQYKLTFYNRLSDACLTNENKPCNDNGPEYKKYGFNSVLAYRQLTKKVYGTDVPSAWLLIVAPEDFGTSDLSFGMSMSVNGYNIPEEFNNYTDQLWQNNVLAPYGTSVFDGLLNTRLFDETSIERNNWFIPNQYTINGVIENADPLAYYRFKHSKYSYWQSDIDPRLISRDSNYFKEKYKELWEATNTSTTALYQISKNNRDSYNGYSDWYIPSALELNIVYHNLDRINNGIVNNLTTDSMIINPQNNYWSSTTGGRLLENNSKTSGVKIYEAPNYGLENLSSSADSLLDTWKNYKVAQAHRAYTQNMNSGKMISALKSVSSARLRACRMVPIYFKNKDNMDQFEFSFKSLNTCTSCR